jgi:hypothetical protein
VEGLSPTGESHESSPWSRLPCRVAALPASSAIEDGGLSWVLTGRAVVVAAVCTIAGVSG